MLDEILQTDSLGDRQQIEYILDIVGSGTVTVPALLEACYARSYGFRRSFPSLVRLLELTDYIVVEGENVQPGNVSPAEKNDRFVEAFCLRLFQVLAEEGCLHHFFNDETLSVDSSKRTVYFRNGRAPLRYASLRNFLISLGLMIRDPYLHNVFVIVQEHYPWFSDGLVDWIGDSTTARKTTLDTLKRRLANQEAAGRTAEEFVTRYERNRLVGHPRLDRVRMISDLDVSAGYDIQSFSDIGSAVIDRYIEVKSYTGNPSFFWSAREVEVAKQKAGAYFLCLVDRDQIESPGYTPIFIRNPANRMFASGDWTCSCEKHYFEKG